MDEGNARSPSGLLIALCVADVNTIRKVVAQHEQPDVFPLALARSSRHLIVLKEVCQVIRIHKRFNITHRTITHYVKVVRG